MLTRSFLFACGQRSNILSQWFGSMTASMMSPTRTLPPASRYSMAYHHSLPLSIFPPSYLRSRLALSSPFLRAQYHVSQTSTPITSSLSRIHIHSPPRHPFSDTSEQNGDIRPRKPLPRKLILTQQ